MNDIFVIMDPISLVPVFVADTLDSAKTIAPTLDLNNGFGKMAVPIYRFNRLKNGKAVNGVKVSGVEVE